MSIDPAESGWIMMVIAVLLCLGILWYTEQERDR